MPERILSNSDILEIEMAVPDGHRHLRTRIVLRNGEELVLQEATLANLVRGYLQIKTHPQTERVRLVGQDLGDRPCKPGFARWQLLEED